MHPGCPARPPRAIVRARPPMIFADSIRQTASMTRWMSDVVTRPSVVARRSAFGDCLEVCQANLEVAADHLVHVEEHTHQLGDERARSVDRPGDVGRLALALQVELGDVV